MGSVNVDYVVPTKGRTPQQVWDDLYGQASSDSGHSYSGDLGSKHGFTGFRLPNASKEALALVYEYLQPDGDEAYDRYPETTTCPARCYSELTRSRGKVAVRVRAHVREVPEILLYDGKPDQRQWLPPAMLKGTVDAWVERDCRLCKGTGEVPLDKEKVAEVRARKRRETAAIAELAGLPKERAAAIYSDKWGPALLIVGKDHTYVGGFCSS